MPSIDLTACDTFSDYFSIATLTNQKLIFTSMQPEVEKQFQQLWDKQAYCPIQHPTVAHALHALHQEY